MQLEFLSYQETPGEKHIGIASIRWMGKIMLRYRLIPRKDGKGHFPAVSSLKVHDDLTGGDSYLESFMIDSRAENDEILRFVMSNVNKSVATPKPETSVFGNEEIPF